MGECFIAGGGSSRAHQPECFIQGHFPPLRIFMRMPLRVLCAYLSRKSLCLLSVSSRVYRRKASCEQYTSEAKSITIQVMKPGASFTCPCLLSPASHACVGRDAAHGLPWLPSHGTQPGSLARRRRRPHPHTLTRVGALPRHRPDLWRDLSGAGEEQRRPAVVRSRKTHWVERVPEHVTS